jgi:hypothetical protein
MRAVPLVWSILLFSTAAFAGEIREFGVPTLERLGNELTRRDHIPMVASVLVLKTQPVARSLKAAGWISELRSAEDRVYFIAEVPSGLCLSYIVTFHGSAKPEVADVRGQPLPSNVALRYKALKTALKALKGHLFNIPYDYEVLNDPDGNGFLVYALVDTGKPGDIVLGGDVRVTVSTDGERAARVDRLSESLNIANKNEARAPRGYHEVAINFNQIVSNKPVETLILASNIAIC